MKESNSFKHTSFKPSLKAALAGLLVSFRLERNFRFQCMAALFVFAMAFLLELGILEWCILIMCICFVLIAELINTAIETMLDLLYPEYHELVGRAKDIAAGVVLLASCMSAVVGILVFAHAIIERFFI